MANSKIVVKDLHQGGEVIDVNTTDAPWLMISETCCL